MRLNCNGAHAGHQHAETDTLAGRCCFWSTYQFLCDYTLDREVFAHRGSPGQGRLHAYHGGTWAENRQPSTSNLGNMNSRNRVKTALKDARDF